MLTARVRDQTEGREDPGAVHLRARGLPDVRLHFLPPHLLKALYKVLVDSCLAFLL